MAKKRKKKMLVGWSVRGRPFSPSEYKKSHIKKGFRMSYSGYLKEFGRQYKRKSIRKYL